MLFGLYEGLRAIREAGTEIGIAGREETGMIFHANTGRLIAGTRGLEAENRTER